MTKRSQYEFYLLAALGLILALVAYRAWSTNAEFTSVQAGDGKFVPLNIPDPSLRLDLLARIQKEEYKGQRRNIFSAEPLPPPPSVAAAAPRAARGPVVPPPPPPVMVPATFFGIVTDLSTGERRACFSANTDDVYIIPDGGTLMNQFRVVKIGGNSVELKELSSGRHTTLMLAMSSVAQSTPPQQGQP